MKEFTLLLFFILSSAVQSQAPVIDGDHFICINSDGNIMITNEVTYDSYQWYKKFAYDEDADYELIPGANSATFTFDSSYNEHYVKVVTTLNGDTFESNEMLIESYFDFGVVVENIFEEDTVYFDAMGAHVCEGHTLQLNVLGLYAYSVQWYRNGEIMPDETSPTLTVTLPGYYEAACAREECPLDFKYSLGTNVDFVECNVANKDFDFSNEIRIHPNPVSDVLHITNSSQIRIKEYSILDVSGKVIEQSATKNSNMEAIDVSHLNSGVYMLVLKNDRYTASKKFIKK